MKNHHGTDDIRTLKMTKPVGHQRPGDKFYVSFEDAYGHRGNAPTIYYLSPWEFTALWTLEYLKPPSSYSRNAKTEWTPAGLAYTEHSKEDKKNNNNTRAEPWRTLRRHRLRGSFEIHLIPGEWRIANITS